MAPNSVPKTHQVIPGAHVNIILKADQPTGRQVSGTVLNVLTRGDHHRGIKVRLTDGRIGRVQSIAQRVEGGNSPSSSIQPASSASSASHLPSFPAETAAAADHGRGPRGPRGQVRQPRYHDFRDEEQPEEQIDLGAYIVPSRRKGKAKKGPNASQGGDKADNREIDTNNNGRQATTQDFSSVIATCPVCGEFEGDEAAVSHHVAEHF